MKMGDAVNAVHSFSFTAAIFAGAYAVDRFEYAAKSLRFVKSDLCGNIGDRHIRGSEKSCGTLNTPTVEDLMKSFADYAFEYLAKIAFTVSCQFGNVLYR